MQSDFEKYDLDTLLKLYMKEARAFSEALSGGASWQELRVKRMHIRMINEYINRKYKSQLGVHERRRDDKPPHE